MKALLFSLIGSLFCVTVFAGLSPAATDQYCPGTNIAFTYSVSGDQRNSYYLTAGTYTTGSISSASYASLPDITTFSFTLNFTDISYTHSITIHFSDGGTGTDVPFDFPKIKSLWNYTDIPSLNVSTITVDSCATSSTNVSFTNLQWKNYSTTPATAFGTITDYLYSVPAGWKVNGSTSTGITDLKLGGNSATIESDLMTPGHVLVRPTNTCTSGLVNGLYTAVINIVRNKPLLTFTSAQTICSPTTFQANSLPGWVTTFHWYVDPAFLSFSTITSNPTTVSTNYDGQGKVGLLISGSGCPVPFFYNNTEITGAVQVAGGKPTVNTTLALYFSPGDENEICFGEETYIPFTVGGAYSAWPTWTEVSRVGNPAPSWSGSNLDLYMYFFNTHQQSIVLQMDASNDCGTTTYQFGFKPVDCSMFRQSATTSNYTISPNPTRGVISISTKKTTSSIPKKLDFSINSVDVYDLNNTLRVSKKVEHVSQVSLNLGNLQPGTYIVVVKNATSSESQQIILK